MTKNNTVSGDINNFTISNNFNHNKVNRKKVRNFFDGSIVSMVREGETTGEYLTKTLNTTRQTVDYHLNKLITQGFIERRDIVHKNGLTHIYGITSLGLKTLRLYRILSPRFNNGHLISKYDCKSNLINKNRYHNFKIIVKVNKNYPNRFVKVSSNVVASNHYLIFNNSFSTYSQSEAVSTFDLINNNIGEYCSNHSIHILDTIKLVDIAQIRRKKQLINEFSKYQDWRYDCSEKVPEREATFKYNETLKRFEKYG